MPESQLNLYRPQEEYKNLLKKRPNRTLQKIAVAIGAAALAALIYRSCDNQQNQTPEPDIEQPAPNHRVPNYRNTPNTTLALHDLLEPQK